MLASNKRLLAALDGMQKVVAPKRTTRRASRDVTIDEGDGSPSPFSPQSIFASLKLSVVALNPWTGLPVLGVRRVHVKPYGSWSTGPPPQTVEWIHPGDCASFTHPEASRAKNKLSKTKREGPVYILPSRTGNEALEFVPLVAFVLQVRQLTDN
ncbi:hypothetical protein P153DRAFT_430364 [Dothidotthia symphoricarpi CBS 119687]|uniref:Uncharacterized protein n=1 Tax=Dothidotthia symphoricarpi CBS 119687 TaxID=1392245 RepID=A0A6A6AJN7_9PLEO|nr:uncharacterized protein P153DRAFT_430364 [Dothidotthia symphoricarpi CBS 119687]KAF2131124.1 hypothetical protein P153DRAFT_430364 [Dothidotthia symphoricarpi CBS 119687]